LIKNKSDESLNIDLSWLYLNTGSNTGKYNMLCDSFLLNSLLTGVLKNPILRIYSWSEPTISLGLNQKDDEIMAKRISNYPDVKRITGGQAVFHDTELNELTYSVCLFYERSVKSLYDEIGKVLLHFLAKYNLKGEFGYSDKNYLSDFNCFSSKTSADIVVNDIKVIGSAQCRKKKYVLQHGSIRLDLIRNLSDLKIDFNKAANDLKSSFEDELKIAFNDAPLYETIDKHIFETRLKAVDKVQA